MIGEVNKLILNTIISNQAVYLPGVGTLYIERKSATMDGNRLTAPQYSVSFSSHAEALSIVDVIMDGAVVGREEAEDIYARWIDKVHTGNELTISGVGILHNKSFVTERELVDSLNRLSPQTLQVTKKKGSAMRFVVAIIAILTLLGGGYYAYIYNSKAPLINDVDNAIQTAEIEDVVTENVTEVVVDVKTPAEEVVPESEIENIPEVVDWRTSKDIRHRVIFGSYSTTENASRAVKDIERRDNELKCDVFQLGSMYAVAIFGSSERSECEEFIRDYRNQFPQAWIYTPKRFK